jgi:hypothetical protein
MTAASRAAALLAVTVTLVFLASPATASAGVGATVCSAAGWVSTLAGKVCTVASDPGRVLSAGKKLAGGQVGGAIGTLAGGATKTVARAAGLAAIAAAVVGGAQYALKLTVKAIGASTNPDLGATWFSSSYWRMAAVAALLTVPFLFAAAIQAMLRSDVTLLLRSAFGYLPLGLLAVGVAAPLTALLLSGSDEMSTIVSAASGHAGASFLDRVGGLGGLIAGGSGTLFLSFFIALFTTAAAITLWLELLIRQAAVYVIVLMLPLFFAAMVWPARRIWAIRAVELLVALILSKFAIVAVLGLGAAALGHTLIPGIGSFLAGTTLVLLAAFSPWAMLRLLPLHELAGAAVGGLRPHAAHQPGVADNRAREATDVTEDAAGEDVPRTLVARLPAMMRRDQHAGDAAADPMGAAVQTAVVREVADGGGVGDDDGVDGSGGAVGHAVAAAGGHPDPSPAGPGPSAAGEGPAAIPEPEEDAYGPTERRGPLPDVFRAMSLDAPVIHLDQLAGNDAGPPPDPGPALPEPGDEPA